MNTSVNNNNIESKNRVINYDIEIVRDFDGTYYVNARNELHEHIKGLPEYLPYKELKKAVKEALGVTLPPLKSLTFEGNVRKQYANAYGLQGIEIHQEPLAFGLQDKVVLGSFGESRPYAIGCTVTGYRWDSEAGEFLYILQGEDGKQYTGFARNIIPDKGNDPKAERQERYNARCKELEAEALAQMPYKVGDTVTSRYGDTGRVIEMHPEITGDIDNPHLIYEYDGKPTVNVVILDADGKRHCAHWSVYTLEPAPEIKAIDVLQVGTMVRMPGVIGGLRVEEIDRKGDRVICVDGCKEHHTYKGLDSFTATAEEIRIPEWLRICQYFEMDESFGHTRVLCTDIEPCCDALWPVLIRWEDGEDKGGIYLTSALDALNCKAYYYSEYQKLGHQEARPQEWLKKTTNEKRATYYRACVELERMAGDGLPLVIRADGADTEANPWNALEKRVKTARVFHLGDRVKMHYPYQCNEVTGVINRIRFDEGSLSLGGWCTHYDIRFNEEYQRPNNFGGKDVGVGVISPERIELVERAEFCPEPAAEWLQPGEKVAHYLDYGDGTGDWLIGNVTGYELCDDGTVIVIYGEYRTPLKGMVKYQPEMDGKAA